MRVFVKNIVRKLANRISYQMGVFLRGIPICERGSKFAVTRLHNVDEVSARFALLLKMKILYESPFRSSSMNVKNGIHLAVVFVLKDVCQDGPFHFYLFIFYLLYQSC